MPSVKLLSFGGQNIFGYESVRIDLTRRNGLILIEGANHDYASTSSNGAGKSSLSEIICYSSTGETIRKIEKQGVESITKFGEKFSLGWSEWQTESGVVKVERYRDHPIYENSVRFLLDGEDTVRGRSKQETTQRINKALGFDYDLFCRVVVYHGRRTESFVSLTDAYLKKITERLVGLPDFNEYYKLTTSNITQLQDTYNRSEEKIENAKANLAAKRLELAGHKTSRNTASKDLKAKQKERQDRIKQLEDERDRLKVACMTQEKQLGVFTKRLAIVQKNTEDSLINLHAVMETHAVEVSRSQDMKDEEERLNGLQGATVCPTCNRKVGAGHMTTVLEAHKVRMATVSDTLKSVVHDLHARQDYYNTERKIKEELAIRVDHLRQNLADEKNCLVSIESRLTELRVKEVSEVNPYIEIVKRCEREILDQETKLSVLQRRHKDLATQAPYLDFWKYGFSPHGLKSFAMDGTTPALNRLANMYLSNLTDGNMTVRFDTVTPTKKGEYRDKFSVSVTNTTGAKVLAGDSDGEVGCVDIALNMALSDILDTRLGGGLGMLWLDEVIDTVDPARGHKVVQLLNQRLDPEWCRERGLPPKHTIFVITHRTEVKDLFPSVLRVEKRGGVCQVIE